MTANSFESWASTVASVWAHPLHQQRLYYVGPLSLQSLLQFPHPVKTTQPATMGQSRAVLSMTVSSVYLLPCAPKPRKRLMLISRCLVAQPPAALVGSGFAAPRPPHGRHALLLPTSLLALLGTCECRCPIRELAALAVWDAGLRAAPGVCSAGAAGLGSSLKANDCCVTVRSTNRRPYKHTLHSEQRLQIVADGQQSSCIAPRQQEGRSQHYTYSHRRCSPVPLSRAATRHLPYHAARCGCRRPAPERGRRAMCSPGSRAAAWPASSRAPHWTASAPGRRGAPGPAGAAEDAVTLCSKSSRRVGATDIPIRPQGLRQEVHGVPGLPA